MASLAWQDSRKPQAHVSVGTPQHPSGVLVWARIQGLASDIQGRQVQGHRGRSRSKRVAPARSPFGRRRHEMLVVSAHARAAVTCGLGFALAAEHRFGPGLVIIRHAGKMVDPFAASRMVTLDDAALR